jgi:Tol biopolymer transport system component
MVYADSVSGLGEMIHVANVDGSNDQAFDRTNEAGKATAPRWSPDGTKVVYQGKTVGQDIGTSTSST